MNRKIVLNVIKGIFLLFNDMDDSEGFVKVPVKSKFKRLNGKHVDKTEDTQDNYDLLLSTFLINLETIKRSQLYKDIKDRLALLKFTKVCCLALGSPCAEQQALYQTCLLYLICQDHKIEYVSLWDPVFNALDNKIFKNYFRYKVEESNDFGSIDTLYFMPHSPITLLESIITDKKPVYLLSNDLSVYSNKFTESQYFEKYPNCARIAKLMQNRKPKEINFNNGDHDGFQVVSKKKGKNKKHFINVDVDYKFDTLYFKSVDVSCFSLGNKFNDHWGNSFTDLSLVHIIM